MISLETTQYTWRVTEFLRTSWGVIRNVPQGEDPQEMLMWCKENCPQGTHVKDIRKMGMSIYSIKFIGSMPDAIQMPFNAQPLPIEPYLPGPARCFKCYGFGHMSYTCVNRARCAKCGLEGHTSAECTSTDTPTCVNCKGAHSPIDPMCPKIKEYKETKNNKIKQNNINTSNIQSIAFSSLKKAWNIEANTETSGSIPPNINDQILFPPVSTKQITNTRTNTSSSPTQVEVPLIAEREAAFEKRILEQMNNIFDQKFKELENKFNNIIEMITNKINLLNIPNNSHSHPPAPVPESIWSLPDRPLAEKRMEDMLEAKSAAMFRALMDVLTTKMIPLLNQGSNASTSRSSDT